MSISILCGDCVEKMQELESGSVQLVVTSPPYGNLRSYNGHSSWDFESTAQQLFRVLCNGGIVCWNVGDEVIKGSESLIPLRQAIYFKDVCGFRVHDTMHWQKNNFANPSFNRYHQVHEYIFVLSKGKPRCFNPIKDKKNAQAGMVGTIGRNSYQKRDGERSTRTTYVTQPFGMRGNIWKGNTAGQENMGKSVPHPAMMPKWLARDLITSWSNEGDTVLDPFAGSGTTGQQAVLLNRKTILIEKNPDYIPLLEAIKPPEKLLFQ